jgi:PAS domain S-box-containing protein
LQHSFPIPANETERLAALRRYRILDTGREDTFDRIAAMAASMLDAPNGSVNFVDADRVWFKTGKEVVEIPRSESFCAHTVASGDVFVIRDTMKSPSFRDNRVIKERKTRFYAAAPLVTRDGFAIGTLCVTDTNPRAPLRPAQKAWLATLAKLVVNELDLRQELAARTEAERDLEIMNRLVLAIAEASSAREALDSALRIIMEATHSVHGSVMMPVAHDDTVHLIAGHASNEFWRQQMETTRMQPIWRGQSLCGLALSHGEPLVYRIDPGAGRFPHMDKRLASHAEICIAVPIVQGGHEFTLHFFFATAPGDTQRLARRIGEMAAKLRPALVRKLSEDRIAILQSVALHANDAALVMVPDNPSDPASGFHIGYVNPAMTQMTGYALEELVGRPSSLLWGDAAGLALEIGMNGAPLCRELKCRRKDGTQFWADINAVPVDQCAEQDRHIVAVMRDTTQRRALEEALREREHTFRLMFSAAPVPMMLLDVKAQRYVEVNDAAISLLGHSREAFLAMSAEAIRAPAEIERYRKMMQTPVPFSGRRGLWRYIKADGGEVLVDVSVHPFRAQGRAMAIVVTVDVTEQKRVEDQILRARDEAEAVSRAKSDLLANMSHELRTPLNAIIGFSQIMREELFGPLGNARYHGYVGDVLESARHLLAVINDILDLAKIEANSMTLNETVVRPKEVIRSALRLVRPRAEEAGIGLDFDEGSPDLAITADNTALKRVLLNLLTNAVKFSEAGTRIAVHCAATDAGIALAVVDHGIGMAPEEIPIALKPFQQVDIGLRRKYEGTGLGLPIAKQLVELHGGELKIESARGVGTTVTILLPPSRLIANGCVQQTASAPAKKPIRTEIAELLR